MGRKSIRKNHLKKHASRSGRTVVQRLSLVFKILAVVAVVSTMSLIMVLAHDLVTQCNFFKARQITVSGNDRLDRTNVLNQAQISNDSNILAVNLSLVRARLLGHPWIDDVDIRRKLPDTLSIFIKEQRPLAILDLGRKFVINTDGVIFKKWSPGDSNDLPVIGGLEFSDIDISGRRPSKPYQAVMSVLHLGRKKRTILPNHLIKKIRVDREIGITLYTSGNERVIKLGYTEFARKYRILEDVLAHLKNRPMFVDVDSIDLNNLNHIVVNPVAIESPVEKNKEV